MADDTCPVPGCSHAAPTIDYVMCRRCWRNVPKDAQNAVYRAWRRRQRAADFRTRDGGRAYDAAVATHERAKQEAIAWAERALDNGQGRLL